MRVLGSENFLHQDSSVGKFAGPAIRFRCAGSRVGGVHLVSLAVKHPECAEGDAVHDDKEAAKRKEKLRNANESTCNPKKV